MNRSDLIGIETDATRRRITAPFELRQTAGQTGLTFRGYASTTEQEYPVFGGTFPGWMETMARGSFKKTLRESADVAFLINHEGMTLARTKSGTMSLREDKSGLAVTAQLDPRQNVVNDLYVASERGDIDEMSFAFRVTRDEWLNEDGQPSNEYEGVQRRITEVNLNKGDVSAVNYGANDTTSGGFRDIEMAMAELRDGRDLTDKQRDTIRQLAAAVGETDARAADAASLDRMVKFVADLKTITLAMDEHMNSMMIPDDIGPDGTMNAPQANKVKLGPQTELLAMMLADLERKANHTPA